MTPEPIQDELISAERAGGGAGGGPCTSPWRGWRWR